MKMSNWTIAVSRSAIETHFSHEACAVCTCLRAGSMHRCAPYRKHLPAIFWLSRDRRPTCDRVSFDAALPSAAPRSPLALYPARNNLAIPRFSAVVFILTALGLALLSGCGQSGGESVISEVSAGATSGNGQRKLVTGPDGTMYIIYVAPRNGTEAAVVSVSDDGGSSWTEEAVLSRPGIPAGLGSLAFDEAGTLHATWVDYETVGHVWYADRTGTTWSDGVKISPGPTYAGFPVVAVGNDAVHVLWYAAQPDDTYRHGSLYEIRDTYQTVNGWSDPVLVSQGSDDALNPSADEDSEGNIHSAWYQIDGEIYQINTALWDGQRWTEPNTVSASPANAKQVAINIGFDDTVNLTWGQLRGGVNAIAFARQVSGSLADSELLSPGPAEDPVVATDSESNVFVAWASDNNVILRSWDGSQWGPPETIGQGRSPTFVSGDPVTIAWTRPTETGFEIVVTDVS